MVSEPVPPVSRGRTEPGRTFVCPFCGTTFPSARRVCSSCNGNLVVPVDESEVYETVLPMCGPDHHLNQPSGESRADGDGLHRWLSRLSAPGLSDWIAPVVERVSRASRRT